MSINYVIHEIWLNLISNKKMEMSFKRELKDKYDAINISISNSV